MAERIKSVQETSVNAVQCKSEADVLVAMGSRAKFFHTSDQTGYADITINGHRETWPIRSNPFRSWLRWQYYRRTGTAPSPNAMASALAVIEARGPNLTPRSRRSLYGWPIVQVNSIWTCATLGGM